MILKSITLTNYKSFSTKTVELDPNINCFIGPNGVGKSNVLDAIYHLSFGKSYFNPISSQNIKHGEDFFAIKGVWEENKNSSTNVDEIKSIIFDKTNELLDNLQQARKEEGQGLQKILSEKLSYIMAFQMSAEKILPEMSDHLKNNFKITIDKIISEHSQLDENKIEQEIAIIAIKQDITEELDRLKVHIVSMQDLLSSSGIIGKKLDFLSQELNREVNTICSKSQYSDLTKLGIEMKTVVDQFREQIQNVE